MAVAVQAVGSPTLVRADEPLDGVVIDEILAAPHDRSGAGEPMKIYSAVRLWSVLVPGRGGDGEGWEVPEPLLVPEKMVAGKYLVTVTTFPYGSPPVATVVHWDEDLRCYRKWTLVEPDGRRELHASRGTSPDGSNAIAWTSIPKPSGELTFGLEVQSEEAVLVRKVTHKDGRLVAVVEGRAVPVADASTAPAAGVRGE